MNKIEQTLALLTEALGKQAILTGDAINQRYYSDWSHHTPTCPAAVILPRTTEQLAIVLNICNNQYQPIVAQGGMTGLTAAAEPKLDQLAISLEKMVGIEEIDKAAATMTVLAGTPLVTIQEKAKEAGFLFPLDLGSRGSCQIGGNISTNAGGNNVIHYGMCRDMVLGLEVVLANGRILNLMNKMIKNNAGYDLKQCFIGSEGTLGIITRAVLKLFPKPKEVTTFLCALPNYSNVVTLLRRIEREIATPQAYEVMWQDFYQLSVSWLENHQAPLDKKYPLFALIDINTSPEFLADILEESIQNGEILDAIIASSEQQARYLWKIREATAEFPTRLKPLNFDISIPIGELGAFAEQCKRRINDYWPEAASYFFGHIADSNLHLTIDLNTLPTSTHLLDIEDLIYSEVAHMQGSISAEHGVGLLKKEFLHYSVPSENIVVMKQIKQTLDPNNILNPGKIFD